MFEEIVLLVGSLLGFAALVSIIVNVLKYFGVVKDGTSDKWVAGFNLVAVIALYVTRLFIPDFDPVPIDTILGEVAVVAGYLFTFVVMIFGSKFTYENLKHLPVVGKTFSDDTYYVSRID